jgi:hypothetical protein
MPPPSAAITAYSIRRNFKTVIEKAIRCILRSRSPSCFVTADDVIQPSPGSVCELQNIFSAILIAKQEWDQSAKIGQETRTPLLQLLRSFGDQDCQDIRDNVYGLLSLTRPDVSRRIRPDYSKTPEDIYAEILHEIHDLDYWEFNLFPDNGIIPDRHVPADLLQQILQLDPSDAKVHLATSQFMKPPDTFTRIMEMNPSKQCRCCCC